MFSRAALITAVIAGLVVAGWHITMVMQAMFVFRENEPLTSWLAIVPVPLLTGIGCLVALVHSRASGAIVAAGALIAAAAFLVGGITEHVTPYLLTFTAPAVIVGAVLFLLRQRARTEAGHAT